MSNLEPIEEADLDLKDKFKVAKQESGKIAVPEVKAEKEIAREVVSAEKDSAYSKILSKVHKHAQNNADESNVSKDAENVYQKTDAESRIQNLVDIALSKGVVHAVKVAKHLEDNYVLDMLHDRLLADELHEALMKKGLIKEI